MNVINKLTLRHMRLNRKRTLVTVMGVIISAAMITAVCTLSFSFLDMMVRDCIARDGLWHAAYYGLDEKQAAAVEQDDATGSAAIRRPLGYASLESPVSGYRPYLFVEEYNDTALKNFPIHLAEGRLPQEQGEIIVSETLLENETVGWKLGDSITLSLGERRLVSEEEDQGSSLNQLVSMTLDEKGEAGEYLSPLGQETFTIVGIMETPNFEYSVSPGYTCIAGFSGMDGDGDWAQSLPVNVYVELNHPDGGLFDHGEILAEAIGLSLEDVAFHSELLRYMGIIGNENVRETLAGLTAVIMSIIIAGSVSLIYNAFAISVSERSRHLGMLSSVGATARQKRNSVFFEGAVIGVISIPLGMVCGLLGIEITFRAINPILQDLTAMETGLRVVFEPMALAGAALLSALTIWISVYLPARRASRVSPIEAIRQTPDIRLTSRMVKTSRLTAKLFGIEGEVALKNLKRNKKRYKATVFSLVISLVLFLSVSYFGENLRASYAVTMEGIEFDTYVWIRSSSDRRDEIADAVMNATHADTAQEICEVDYLMPTDFDSFERTRLVVMDDETLQDYAREAGVSPERFFQADSWAAIAVDTITYRDELEGKYVTKRVMEAQKGREWPLYRAFYEEEDSVPSVEEEPFATLRLEGFTDVLPTGISTTYDTTGAILVVSKTVAQQIFAAAGEEGGEMSISHQVFMTSDQPEKLMAELEAMDEPDMYINSLTEMYKKERQLLFLMSVFVYGFITLITLICVANIFNTISTSIALRRREFAMLRSVGMTPAGFNRMIRYESMFYGIKALLYGLPLSFLLMLLLHRIYANTFDAPFTMPWKSLAAAILAVFLIVSMTMIYAASKVKKENIIDCLREESI